MSTPAGLEAAVGVLAPLYLEQRTARPLARRGWRVVHCGVGGARAAAAVDALRARGARRVLLWGTAGALEPGLAPGMLVVPERVVGPRGETFAFDPGWRAELLTRLGPARHIRGGVLASVVRPVATPAEKSALAARTGAAVVDMEAAAVAAAAATAGLPCMVLRAVVDPLELVLPGVVLAAVGDRFLAPEIALRLLVRPRDLPAVLRLDRAFRPARRALADAARTLAAPAGRGA